jgi:hypothetical protein
LATHSTKQTLHQISDAIASVANLLPSESGFAGYVASGTIGTQMVRFPGKDRLWEDMAQNFKATLELQPLTFRAPHPQIHTGPYVGWLLEDQVYQKTGRPANFFRLDDESLIVGVLLNTQTTVKRWVELYNKRKEMLECGGLTGESFIVVTQTKNPDFIPLAMSIEDIQKACSSETPCTGMLSFVAGSKGRNRMSCHKDNGFHQVGGVKQTRENFYHHLDGLAAKGKDGASHCMKADENHCTLCAEALRSFAVTDPMFLFLFQTKPESKNVVWDLSPTRSSDFDEQGVTCLEAECVCRDSTVPMSMFAQLWKATIVKALNVDVQVLPHLPPWDEGISVMEGYKNTCRLPSTAPNCVWAGLPDTEAVDEPHP